MWIAKHERNVVLTIAVALACALVGCPTGWAKTVEYISEGLNLSVTPDGRYVLFYRFPGGK
jgi:hypothetical protein